MRGRVGTAGNYESDGHNNNVYLVFVW